MMGEGQLRSLSNYRLMTNGSIVTLQCGMGDSEGEVEEIPRSGTRICGAVRCNEIVGLVEWSGVGWRWRWSDVE